MHDFAVSMGPLFWHLSRALGVAAYVGLTLEVVLGLSASTGELDRILGRGRVVELHRWLSLLVFGLMAGHALVLLGDQTVRLGVLDLVVPFTSDYRPFAVGLGVIGVHAAALLQVSFWLRKRIGPKAWRKLHYVAFGLFAVATLHGLLAGSDASAPAMKALYVGAALLVSTLTLLRILRFAWPDLRGPSPRASASPPAAGPWPTGDARTPS